MLFFIFYYYISFYYLLTSFPSFNVRWLGWDDATNRKRLAGTTDQSKAGYPDLLFSYLQELSYYLHSRDGTEAAEGEQIRGGKEVDDSWC